MTLRETQRRLAAAIMVPLTPSGRIAKKSRRGTLLSQEAAYWIKPNGRLSPLERLEIYSRSYWFRLLDSLHEDFPGLEAVLGSRAFERLAKAYLDDCPSHSFTLRDLGSRLGTWLREHPEHAGRNPALALDMVHLEWAHIVAFDGPEEEILGPADLVGLSPMRGAGLQPYISLLELNYPVDELRLKVATRRQQRAVRRVLLSKPEQIFLAVHRLDSNVYYRRLGREEFRLLQAMRSGRSIAASIRAAFDVGSETAEDVPELLKTWFSTWAQFGWLSAPRGGKKGKVSS